MKLSCALVDDEPLALGLLESYAAQTPFLEVRGAYANAIEAMEGLKTNPVDLLFLDIQMPGLSGLDFSKMLPADTRIVFTTAFSQYAVDGYRVNALDYLLKPVSYADFLAAARRAEEWFRLKRGDGAAAAVAPAEDNDSFFVKSDYKLVRIRFNDIIYIEGLKDYVKIYLENVQRPLLSLTSMHAVEEALPATRFYRIHRSFIVNMEKVSVVERGQIVFGDKRLPVSDSYKERVAEYLTRRTLQGRR